MFITLSMVTIKAGGAQGDIHLASFWLLLVIAKGAIEVFKGAVEPAVTEVTDFKINKGMLPFLVNHIISCQRRTTA